MIQKWFILFKYFNKFGQIYFAEKRKDESTFSNEKFDEGKNEEMANTEQLAKIFSFDDYFDLFNVSN